MLASGLKQNMAITIVMSGCLRQRQRASVDQLLINLGRGYKLLTAIKLSPSLDYENSFSFIVSSDILGSIFMATLCV